MEEVIGELAESLGRIDYTVFWRLNSYQSSDCLGPYSAGVYFFGFEETAV
jgi:hypothetical protein